MFLSMCVSPETLNLKTFNSDATSLSFYVRLLREGGLRGVKSLMMEGGGEQWVEPPSFT